MRSQNRSGSLFVWAVALVLLAAFVMAFAEHRQHKTLKRTAMGIGVVGLVIGPGLFFFLIVFGRWLPVALLEVLAALFS